VRVEVEHLLAVIPTLALNGKDVEPELLGGDQ
jgi:Aspartate/ornithine carbamoyltransferase, Asp/Orn binding domain